MQLSNRKRFGIGFLVMSLLVLFVLPTTFAEDKPQTVQLAIQNNSGISGTATLTDMGNNTTKVTVNVTGAPAGVSMPAHIHNGTCATLDPKPVYPLKNIENGTSETMVNVSLASLGAKQYAINLHKSATEASVYVACGDLALNVAAAPAAPSSSATAPSAAPAAGQGFSGSKENGIPAPALLGLALAVIAGAGSALLALKRR